MPKASSNRRSAGAGSGAEAERKNRTRLARGSGRLAGGSSASTLMMAGTALTQVISCCSISAQKPRRLNFRSTTRQAPAVRVASRPTTSALMWNSGRQQ